MKSLIKLTPGILVFSLVGCVSPETIPPESLPSENFGFIGGNFTLISKNLISAFVLTNEDTLKEYILPFITKSKFKEINPESTVLIAVPPGNYKVTHWIVYNSGSGPEIGREFKRDIKDSKLTELFTIKTNEIVFIGKFVSEVNWTPGITNSTTSGRWKANKISNIEAKELILKNYPNLSSIKFTCIACSQ